MLSDTPAVSSAAAFLRSAGPLAELIANFDWAATELGAIDQWPHSLRTAVGLAVHAPSPICLLWGEHGYMIYNDAFVEVAGQRHPHSLGAKVRDAWPEVFAFNDHVMKTVLAGGTLSYVDQEFTFLRNGVTEQAWLTLNYSPVLDETGRPAGVISLVQETTSKVRAERWLKAEPDRLRSMFEQAPGFVAMLYGPDHVFDLVNQAYLQLVGHREVVGKAVREALPDIAGQGFFELLDTVFTTGETFTGHGLAVSLQRAPGAVAEERFVDLVYQAIRNPLHEIIGIFVQGTDVTEQVRAEQAVRAGEAQFEAFAQAMPNHVWSARPDGRLDWFNFRVYEYSGAAEGNLDGDAWGSIVHPDDIDAAAARWSAALASQQVYEAEFRLRRADGVYRWHLARAVPIKSATDDQIRWIGTNTDIEDQKAVLQTLAHLNTTLEQQVSERTADRDRMWTLSTDVMLVASFESMIMSVNPAWNSMLGWMPDELVGRSFMNLVHVDDQAQTQAEVDRLRDGQTTFRFTNRVRCKDGTYRCMTWTAVPDERFIHAVGRDVTAEMEAAEALARSENALRQSQKMEAVGQLTGGIAHDFNNMLAVVIGSLDMVKRRMDTTDRRQVRYVAAAIEGAQRAAVLTQRLLAFSRQQPLQPESLDANKLVTNMSDLLRHSIGAEIRLEAVLAGGLWRIHADPNQLENVILNLAVNARDAMPDGGRLTIETQNAHLDARYVAGHLGVSAGQYVMIAVTDTGTGMSEDVIAKAFDPFFTTKAPGKGTGLGLSQVYGFIKQSGGHLKIYSELGEGTTIKVYLPRLEGVAIDVADRRVESELAMGDQQEVVLVVEDEPTVRRFSVDALTELGYRVLEADGAVAALRMLELHPEIALLFTDVVMPDINGRKLADEARRRWPRLKVLFTTGYTRNAVVHNGVLDSGVALLSKPYVIEELATKVREVLDTPDDERN